MKEKTFNISYKTIIIVLAVLLVLLFSSIVLLAIGANPLKAFYKMLFEPLTKTGHIKEIIIRAIPLCIIALGVCIAYRSGIINIGAEGQMYMGLIAFTGFALLCPNMPKFFALLFAFFFAAIAGGIWGFIPGILKAKLNVSELLSTVMLNYTAAQLYSLCLRTIYMDPTSSTPMSVRLSKSYSLSRISSPVHTGLFFALIFAVLVFILMWYTTTGYKMRAVGLGSRAARYGGINVALYTVLAMVLAGALAGVAGAIEIAGVHHRAIEGITNNYGFSGVVVALFGGLHPAGIIPASFLFGLLIYGSTFAATQLSVPANIVQVMQGITILVIVTAQMIMSDKYLQDRIKRKLKLNIVKSEVEEKGLLDKTKDLFKLWFKKLFNKKEGTK